MQITKISVLASKKLVVNYNSTSMSVGISATLDPSDNLWESYQELDRQAKAMVEQSLGIEKKRLVLKLAS